MKWIAATRALAIVAAILLGILLLLNLPFYAGAGLGEGLSWRMEHGRLGITKGPGHERDDFWLALNSEGLKWKPEFRGDSDAWEVQLPIWIPFATAVLWAALASSGRRPSDPHRD